MSWSPQIAGYGSSGTFMDFFESLTYEHVNFIFAGAQYPQESTYPSTYSNTYKFGQSEAGSMSYYDYGNSYVIGHHTSSAHMENSSATVDEQNTASHTPQEGNSNSNSNLQATRVDCPQRHNTARDYQAVWQDNVDPDSMTYEELLELGEAVGTQNRGLSQELISTLPISKFKCGFFSRKRSRNERCVICQMEYKRRERRITLPCKHAYHADCGSRWLSINKACPICYKEVFAGESKS